MFFRQRDMFLDRRTKEHVFLGGRICFWTEEQKNMFFRQRDMFLDRRIKIWERRNL